MPVLTSDLKMTQIVLIPVYFSCSLQHFLKIKKLKAWPNWTTLFANMSIIMLEECSWTFHVVDRSDQIGQHCSPTNSIRHKLNAIYIV